MAHVAVAQPGMSVMRSGGQQGQMVLDLIGCWKESGLSIQKS